ncbi:collagen alpha-1(III) chain-like [Saccopteryx bilineata]|uniref:collagen alpha-1(III) chain-like n=1 Tax=Saccopteryx bilineata TaxID=59482 RepID=UPI00338F8A3C
MPLVENKDAFSDQKENRPECLRKETPQGGEVNILQSSGGPGWISQAWEVAQGEAPTQPQEEGSSQGVAGDFCRSLGEQRPPPGGTESPGPQGRSTQQIQDKAYIQRGEAALAVGEQGTGREGELAPLGPLARPHLTGPGAGMLAVPGTSEPREHPTALPGHPGLQDPGGGRCPAEQQVGERGLQPGGSVTFPGSLEERRGAAGAPKTAWSRPPGRAEAPAVVSAAQQKAALQRLLELHRAARDRRRQDREQQRLRVLEGLRIARNRHCRVHPLGPPPSPAQLLPQEDAEGQRRALREQLEQVHRERTGRLQALGARNTQNFQQLLCPPGAEEAAPRGSAHGS